MTLNDLKSELSQLGFEKDIELDAALVFSVRRALNTLFIQRGVYNKISIEHYPIMPTIICKRLTHKGKETESFEIEGKAYSFLASGKGSFTVEENGVSSKHSFSSVGHIFRGFISGRAKISFSGDYDYEIISLASYNAIRSDSVEDIHLVGEPYEYRLTEICKDFHSFTSLPQDKSGREISNASFSGDRLFIPEGYEGKISVSYKACAPTVSIDTPDSEIDIPKELEHLIALLAASYYWVDDAPDKAEYYLSLYREAISNVKRYETRSLGGGYINVTGWA